MMMLDSPWPEADRDRQTRKLICDNNGGKPWDCEGGRCHECGGCDVHCVCG